MDKKQHVKINLEEVVTIHFTENGKAYKGFSMPPQAVLKALEDYFGVNFQVVANIKIKKP